MENKKEIQESPDGTKSVSFDSEGLQSLVEKNEGIIIYNDLIGLNITLTSKRVPINELSALALEVMKRTLELTPTRIPLGVG